MADALKRAREERQERVAKVVWGLLLVTMGVLFSLHNAGRIDLSPPSRHLAGNAVDGDAHTRWASEFSSPQWLEIDLGATAALTRVKLNWENAHARVYQIQVSNDRSNWTTVVDASDRKGGVEEHPLSTSARYVRMYGTKRATQYGYSLFEFEVYGTPASAPGAEQLLSQGKPASASSLERQSAWWLYWPLALIALGLPALLAPKNDGDQVVGTFLTAAGVLMQLHSLGITPWGFSEWLPVLLMLGGAMLVVQALRRAQAASGRSDGEGQGGAQ